MQFSTEEKQTKKRFVDFLNAHFLMQHFLIDAFASGYKVRTVNRMITTVKEPAFLEDGIIIHRDRQRSKADWSLYTALWKQSLLEK